ncbi:hypothetical protein AGMMS50230_00850 [Spirochaetia bacterium]|nr:hypothetical protein AGMMS50230_00850 [Spirochaetia bacterium]
MTIVPVLDTNYDTLNTGIMTLSYEEKIEMMKSLNWDTTSPPEDMLAVVEGRLEKTGGFDQERLFLRCLGRVPWHRLVALWGVEKIKELYTPKITRALFPRELRIQYDFALAVLRREPVSAPGWGSEYHKQLQHAFLSNRWNRA